MELYYVQLLYSDQALFIFVFVIAQSMRIRPDQKCLLLFLNCFCTRDICFYLVLFI